MVNEEMVTISKIDYENLKERSLILSALEYLGVDNWEWYGEAMDVLNKWKGEIK